ncbi:hypothetical protein EGM88_12495 [Aureibaculum marinum]|uniref:Circularly permuted type 2 ATP-grasp protein n=1 Tax=Aureibaculum marinum TaxID=2487930 RepID=A0A3N4NDY4_9FLAO|nr:hypothetical protein [Aureibaculum marinum]RPD94391.1 hypothetical protein EGM88_12495 [Aureibaculum marinum]
MIPNVRNAFNKNFKQEYYQKLQLDIEDTFGEPSAFRISETPVFIDATLKNKIFDACNGILEQLSEIDFNKIRQKFIPKSLQSPSPIGNPHFLAIDFGLCDDGKGNIEPQLIELQAFPTLFFYQHFLGKAFLKHYPIIPKEDFYYFFSNLNDKTYVDEVKNVILGNQKPENVILMELFPEKQKTRIDFWATKKALGIEVVCMTQIIKEGKKLFYIKDGVKKPIHRIYNRVILDELLQIKNLKTSLNLNDAVDVEWVTHPDWFFMISKCILPLLEHKYIPKSYYLNEYPSDLDLSNYVLKPLFSFAGKGINLYPTKDIIATIQDKENYILQKKVAYAPLIKTNTAKNSKVELRMLYVWDNSLQKLKPVINLTRMSKGELINVSYLTQDTWIGSSISFFEK